MSEKRIEKGISKTAQWTLIARAVSNSEKNSYYKSGDYLARIFIPGFEKFKTKFILKMKCRYFSVKGGYEQVIARTKYIDDIFSKIEDDVTQVVLLGAGFDTRAVRFSELLKNKTVFEIDSPYTQKAKTVWLSKIKFKLPGNIKFISMDLDKSNLEEQLVTSGFRPDHKSLFILEGLLMYLQPDSVEKLFTDIKRLTPSGSAIVFDYIYKHAMNPERNKKNRSNMAERVADAGEGFHFGLETNALSGFLNEYGFEIINESGREELEKKFFSDKNGKIKVRMKGEHGRLVTAVKS